MVQAPFSSGPFVSSPIVIEAIFPCLERVPTRYFRTLLLASLAFSMRNHLQLVRCSLLRSYLISLGLSFLRFGCTWFDAKRSDQRLTRIPNHVSEHKIEVCSQSDECTLTFLHPASLVLSQKHHMSLMNRSSCISHAFKLKGSRHFDNAKTIQALLERTRTWENLGR